MTITASRPYFVPFPGYFANAPYFAEHLQFLDHIFTTGFDRPIDFNLTIMRHLMLNLGVDTEIRRLSELNIL